MLAGMGSVTDMGWIIVLIDGWFWVIFLRAQREFKFWTNLNMQQIARNGNHQIEGLCLFLLASFLTRPSLNFLPPMSAKNQPHFED